MQRMLSVLLGSGAICLAYIVNLAMVAMLLLVGCVQGESKDPEDSGGETDAVEDENACDQLLEGTWQDKPNVIRLDGNIQVENVTGGKFGYSVCTGHGWTCAGNYTDQSDRGSVSCWGGSPEADQPADITFTGSTAGGRLGIKCFIATDGEVTYLLTSAQYSSNPSGEANAGTLYALILDTGLGGVQDVEAMSQITITGVGENSYFDTEYVPQDVVGRYSDELCFGNTNSDPAYGGLYCFNNQDFWRITPGSRLTASDLTAYGAQHFSQQGIQELTGGITTWYPYYSAPVSVGRAIGDPRFDMGGPNAGLVDVIGLDGSNLLSVTGVPGAGFGTAVVEVPFNQTTAIIASSTAADAALIANVGFTDQADLDLGTIYGTKYRESQEAGGQEFSPVGWGAVMHRFELCGTDYVAITAPDDSRTLQGENVGSMHIYRAQDLLAAGQLSLEDPENIDTSPIPLVTVFGPQDGNFGWSMEVVASGELPLETKFYVGNPGAASIHIFTLGSLLEP